MSNKRAVFHALVLLFLASILIGLATQEKPEGNTTIFRYGVMHINAPKSMKIIVDDNRIKQVIDTYGKGMCPSMSIDPNLSGVAKWNNGFVIINGTDELKMNAGLIAACINGSEPPRDNMEMSHHLSDGEAIVARYQGMTYDEYLNFVGNITFVKPEEYHDFAPLQALPLHLVR